ncbi:MAG: exo-alpha-sialidase, partial [Verrucomicrobia bacterium]|nr:exo-alpha-sialidase [Verrucomicrobiota bacterium]
MKNNLPHCIVALILLLGGRLGADENRDIKIVGVQKIWDAAPHNAFTDLERFNGSWYCAFREGHGHAGGGDYGKIRVIASNNGTAWKSVALLQTKRVDLRDAKLSITPTGELLL